MSSLLDLLKAKKQSIAAASGNRQKTIKPAMGTGRYRILPSWRGAGQQFWHDFGQHFVKNAAKEITAIYMCADKTYGRPCAVCEALSQATRAASDDFTMELLKDAKASNRVLVNALHLDGPENMRGVPQILELSPSAFAAVVAISTEWEEAGESIFSLSSGRDILITREGAGLKTKYQAQIAAKSVAVSADVADKLCNLDEYVAQESADQQARALNSVRAVVGLLPAPSAPSGLPAAAAPGAARTEDDMYEAAPVPPRKAAPAAPAPASVATAAVALGAEQPWEDATVKPAKATVAKATPPVESTGDSELDDLLNGLTG